MSHVQQGQNTFLLATEILSLETMQFIHFPNTDFNKINLFVILIQNYHVLIF